MKRPVELTRAEIAALREVHQRAGRNSYEPEGWCTCGRSRVWELCDVVRLLATLDGDAWDENGETAKKGET